MIVAAVKNDTDAIKELKERVIHSGIRTTLAKMDCSAEEKMQIEQKIVELIFSHLHRYQFNGSFGSYGFRIAVNISIHYRDKKTYPMPDKNNLKEKLITTTPLPSGDESEKPKHPPLEQIDHEIRTLVHLLNQSPNIKTSGSSCSGHPNQEKWDNRQWSSYGGYIGIIPISSPRKAFDFLNGVLMHLDNSGNSTNKTYLPAKHKIEGGISKMNATSQENIHGRYKQVQAEELYSSGVPVVLIQVSFRFFVCQQEKELSLNIWKQLIGCVKELIPEDNKLTTKVDTPEMAMQLLQVALQKLPFIFSSALETSQEGFPGIVMTTVADLALFQWFSVLADMLYEQFNGTKLMKKQNSTIGQPYVMKWAFKLRPYINQELIPLPHLLTPKWKPRTREDHLKIWQLLELAVTEQLNCEKSNMLQRTVIF